MIEQKIVKRKIPIKLHQQLESPILRQATLFSKIFFLICICTILIVNKELQTEICLLHQREVTNASICNIDIGQGRPPVLNYTWYTYKVDNTVYYNTILTEEYLQHHYDNLWVEYYPLIPSLSKPEGSVYWDMMGLIIALLFISSIWILSRSEALLKIDKRLKVVQNGDFARAKIVSKYSKNKQSTHPEYRYNIIYLTTSGELIKQYFMSSKSFPKHDLLLILYLPKKPNTFLVVDNLPVQIQRVLKKQSGMTDFTLTI